MIELLEGLRQELNRIAGTPPEPARIVPADCVTVKMAASLTGLTESAIRHKIYDGKWLEGREYFRAEDGGVFVSLKGYEKWVKGSKYTARRSG